MIQFSNCQLFAFRIFVCHFSLVFQEWWTTYLGTNCHPWFLLCCCNSYPDLICCWATPRKQFVENVAMHLFQTCCKLFDYKMCLTLWIDSGDQVLAALYPSNCWWWRAKYEGRTNFEIIWYSYILSKLFGYIIPI